MILYTTTLINWYGALLAQVNEGGKEKALHYLGYHLIQSESNYPLIEKHYIALVYVV